MLFNKKDGLYIVYDPKPWGLVRQFVWFTEAHQFAERYGLELFNMTHPTNKEELLWLEEGRDRGHRSPLQEQL